MVLKYAAMTLGEHAGEARRHDAPAEAAGHVEAGPAIPGHPERRLRVLADAPRRLQPPPRWSALRRNSPIVWPNGTASARRCART